MTKKDDDAVLQLAEEHAAETEGALNQMLETTIRDAWLPNTLAWVVAVGGAFVLNLLLLILVTG